MANIDLTSLYRRRSDKVSAVDSDIVLNKAETDNIIYSDLKLDLEFTNFKERQLNAKESDRDLSKITNEKAVITSLKNILNTTRRYKYGIWA